MLSLVLSIVQSQFKLLETTLTAYLVVVPYLGPTVQAASVLMSYGLTCLSRDVCTVS